MMIQITARHMDVGAKLRRQVEARVQKLDRFIDGITDVHVTLWSEKYRQMAEVNVHSRGKLHLSATETAEELRVAVGKAVEKIEAQAKKQQAKRIDKRRRRTDPWEGVGTFNVIAGEPAAPEATASPRDARVIESHRFVIKPLTVEEAVLQIEEESAEFLVFRDANSERTNVLYRRPDGNYGLIDPEK